MVSGSPIIACFERAPANRPAATGADQRRSSNLTAHLPTDADSSAGVYETKNGIIGEVIGKRNLQHVLTVAQRAQIVAWMKNVAAQDGDMHIPSKTVRNFPQFFRASANANLVCATRLWADRTNCENSNGEVIYRGSSSSMTRLTKLRPRRVRMKVRSGRGRKRQAWMEAPHQDARSEFDRLRKLGVKFNLRTLRALANFILESGGNEAYSGNLIDPLSGRPLFQKINARWVQSFEERFRIVSRAHTGKHRMSYFKELTIKREVSYHLGTLSRMMTAGEIDENYLENADKTHFITNMDNGRTLGFAGDTDVKYADVVSRGQGMTTIVRLSSSRDARVEPPFMVFMNKDRSYLIRGTPDDRPDVAHRTCPRGWMDTRVMPEWLSENRVISALPNGRRRVLFVDNCSRHSNTDALDTATQKIRTCIRYFPPNATHLVQPCDSFVIRKIKSTWSTRWEKLKMKMVCKNMWKDKSGRLLNPGKSFFLRLATDSVADVNKQRDADGLSFARKAMILTGIAMNTNGRWEEKQLSTELQRIIRITESNLRGRK